MSQSERLPACSHATAPFFLLAAAPALALPTARDPESRAKDFMRKSSEEKVALARQRYLGNFKLCPPVPVCFTLEEAISTPFHTCI